MFLSQAAMDFLVEENLKAHVSCWYIKKYIEDHPQQNYKDLVITWLQPVCAEQPQINDNLMDHNVQNCRGQTKDVKLLDLQHLKVMDINNN